MRDAQGRIAELTSSGTDEAPVLSDDGLHVIFRRARAADGGSSGDLYCARVDAARTELLVRDDPASFLDPREKLLPLTGFFNVGFMPDNRRGIFSIGSGRGEAIVTVDLETKKRTWLTSGFGYEHVLIRTGPNKGNLIVMKHEYPGRREDGPIDACYLVDGRTGKKLRDVTGIDSECTESAAMKLALGF